MSRKLTSKKITLFLMLFVFLGAIYSVLDFIIPTKVSYKVTVVIETEQSVKEGSATAQFVNKPRLIRGYNTGNPAKSRINAVVIDVGSGHKVYAIWGASLFYKAFPYENGVTTRAGLKYHRNLKVGAQSQSSKFPVRLIYFEDKDDARTIKVLDTVDVNHLANIDETIQLKNIIVEKISNFKNTNKSEVPLPSNFSSDEYMDWFKSLQYGDERRILISDFR